MQSFGMAEGQIHGVVIVGTRQRTRPRIRCNDGGRARWRVPTIRFGGFLPEIE